ncbi:hypothetical protein [Sporosarcina sp. 6E9]|uniref:hypothetical protein n=1 Tax=Sporosarcina sp. 6E9 TaxID=2819235 RepID=UPI001AD4FD33|nr:hypothetical protein [Sporosarcina sp. 6E9]MBO1909767.1 hypothetical protein [Microvirga sp. 3-52]
MILNSNAHKLQLSSWLSTNQPKDFTQNLKLQKFLFFYEAFSKMDGEDADFNYLRAYPNGPVFSNVYGDYIYHGPAFFPAVESIEIELIDSINEERAKLSGFLVKILNEDELSDLTHELDAWKVHEPAIRRGEKNISIREEDFTEDDFLLLRTLREMYPSELIDNSAVISIMDKNFLLSIGDFMRLTEDQKNVFLNLVDEDLENPVYVSLSDEGVLLID